MNNFDRLRLLGLLPLSDSPDASDSTTKIVSDDSPKQLQHIITCETPKIKKLLISKGKLFTRQKDKNAPLVSKPEEPKAFNCRIGRRYKVTNFIHNHHKGDK